MEKRTHVTAALEDYLEAILHLSEEEEHAHSNKISLALNVHKSTVTAALRTLRDMGLINYNPYEAATLTPEGRKIAVDVTRRHNALKNFLLNILKVDEEVAESAACGMEHSIPRIIVNRLIVLADKLQQHPEVLPEYSTKKAPQSLREQPTSTQSARLRARPCA